jgi:hypothetical protein
MPTVRELAADENEEGMTSHLAIVLTPIPFRISCRSLRHLSYPCSSAGARSERHICQFSLVQV